MSNHSTAFIKNSQLSIEIPYLSSDKALSWFTISWCWQVLPQQIPTHHPHPRPPPSFRDKDQPLLCPHRITEALIYGCHNARSDRSLEKSSGNTKLPYLLDS